MASLNSPCQVDRLYGIKDAGGLGSFPKRRYLGVLSSGQPGLLPPGGSDMRVRRTISIRLRRPTTIVLALVSSSDPKKPPYKISIDKQNLVFCTCKGWRYNGHSCSHLTAFRQSLASAAEQVTR